MCPRVVTVITRPFRSPREPRDWNSLPIEPYGLFSLPEAYRPWWPWSQLSTLMVLGLPATHGRGPNREVDYNDGRRGTF